MTTPTQAQIEAAAKAAWAAACDPDEPEYEWQDYLGVAKAALTAAAQVGEQGPITKLIEATKPLDAATIERCAQWLEDDGNHATARVMREALLGDAAVQVGEKPLDPNIVYPGKDLTNVFPEETE